MKKLIRLTVNAVFAVALFVLAGCTEKDEPKPVGNEQLGASTGSLSFAAAGETKTFNVTSTADWMITGHQAVSAWLTVSPVSDKGNATVTVTVEANTTTTARNADLTISAEGLPSVKISITQQAGSGGNNNGGDDDVSIIPEKGAIKYLSKATSSGDEMTFIISHDRYGERSRVDTYAGIEGAANMHISINLIDHAAKEFWMWIFLGGWGQGDYSLLNSQPNVPRYEKGVSLEQFLLKEGFVRQGTMTVIDKECKVYVGKLTDVDGREYNHKFAVWNGMRMFQETDADGGLTWTATAVNLDAPEKAFSRATLNVDWI